MESLNKKLFNKIKTYRVCELRTISCESSVLVKLRDRERERDIER